MNIDLARAMTQDSLWEESARYTYNFPLSTRKDMRKVGKRIGRYPTPEDTMYPLGPFMASRSPASHVGPMKWAIDFLVPDGTIILAARNGRVREVFLDSKEWGPTEEMAGKTNYITIEHHDEHGPIEYSQYCHVARPRWFRKQLVKQGSWVKCGQPISYVEKNGWTDRDHLHFMIFRIDHNTSNPFGFKSLQIEL